MFSVAFAELDYDEEKVEKFNWVYNILVDTKFYPQQKKTHKNLPYGVLAII